MKGKRHTTEERIRILREADSGKNIIEVCRDGNISEVTFHRWKREFGKMDVSEAKRLKDLERENNELEKMLADSMLKNRVLQTINAKRWCARSTSDGWPPSLSNVACVPGERSTAILGSRGRRIATGRDWWHASTRCRRPTHGLGSAGSWRCYAGKAGA